MLTRTQTHYIKSLITVFAPFAICFVFTSIFRTINAVQAPTLVQTLSLSAHEISLLSAAFFLGYGLTQLPLGLLLDRFPPKYIQLTLLCIASAGMAIFAHGHHANTLILARLMIGIGLAGGLTASLKMNVLYFPAKHLAIINSVLFTIGGLGALFATQPAYVLFTHYGWRHINWSLAGATLIAMCLLLWLAPSTKATEKAPHHRLYIRDITLVLRNSFFWHIAPLIMTISGFSLALQGLWAGAWLRHVGGYPPHETAHILLIFSFAMLLGNPLTMGIAYIAHRKKIPLLRCLVVCVACIIASEICIIDGIHLPHHLSWFCFGFLVQTMTLVFTIVSEHFANTCNGRATTSLILVLFVAGFAIQYAMSFLLPLWPMDATGSYPLIAYRTVFGFFVLLQLLALAWLLIGMKKHDKHIKPSRNVFSWH